MPASYARHRPVHFSVADGCYFIVNYIHRNPVKHGYVAAPEEWPHSSWPHFTDLDPQSAAAMTRFPAPRQLPNDP